MFLLRLLLFDLTFFDFDSLSSMRFFLCVRCFALSIPLKETKLKHARATAVNIEIRPISVSLHLNGVKSNDAKIFVGKLSSMQSTNEIPKEKKRKKQQDLISKSKLINVLANVRPHKFDINC